MFTPKDQPVLTEEPVRPEMTVLLTCFRHALRSLHSGVEHLFGGDEEDVVRGLIAVHHLQFLHQEVYAAVCVLFPHLEGHHSNISFKFILRT